MTILDDKGLKVRDIEFKPGDRTVRWDGKRDDDKAAEPGGYRATVSYTTVDGKTETASAESWSRVNEVRQGADGPELTLTGGFMVKAGSIVAMRSPNDASGSKSQTSDDASGSESQTADSDDEADSKSPA